jgi:hypothetical protein
MGVSAWFERDLDVVHPGSCMGFWRAYIQVSFVVKKWTGLRCALPL